MKQQLKQKWVNFNKSQQKMVKQLIIRLIHSPANIIATFSIGNNVDGTTIEFGAFSLCNSNVTHKQQTKKFHWNSFFFHFSCFNSNNSYRSGTHFQLNLHCQLWYKYQMRMMANLFLEIVFFRFFPRNFRIKQ